MALPHQLPRIIGVLDPGNGFYRVSVLMTPELASRYPNKPWVTQFSEMGLHGPDALKYKDYVLVEIVQPTISSPDLVWVFQKLDGPVWTTRLKGALVGIPEKFLKFVNLTKTKQEVLPDTAPDEPSGPLVQSTVEQKENTGIAIKENTSYTLDSGTAPFVSPSLEDQLYVTTEILVAEGSQPDGGDGVVTSVVDAIGNGLAVKTSKIAVTSYTNKTTWTPGYAMLLGHTIGSADSIPSKFRSAQGFATWRFKVQSASPPSSPALGTGSGAYSGYTIVERASRQIQENGSTDVFEMVIVGLAAATAPLIGYGVGDGDLRTTITEELVASAGLSLPANTATAKYTADALGNGMHAKQTVEQDVFGQEGFSISAPDIIPQKFRAALPETSTEETIAGTAAMPTLGTGELSKAERQVTEYTKRVSTTERDPTVLPVSLSDTFIDNDGIVVTRVQTLDDDAQAITPSATVSGGVESLGNGLTLKTEDTKAEVFDSRTISHAQTVNIPAKFVIGEETESEIVAGTNAVPAELGSGGSGVVTASSQRVDAFRLRNQKATRTISDDALSGSQVFSNFGGGVADTEESIVADTTQATGGFLVISSTVTPIGQGKAIQETVTANASFPQLVGQKYDPEFGIDIGYTEQVVPAGTSSVGADIDPIDQWRSKIKETDYDAYKTSLLGVHVVLPGEENVNIPDTLKSVTILASRAQAIGNTYGRGRSFNMDMSGTVSVSADLSFEVEEGYSGPVPSETHIFFMPQDQANPAQFIKTKCDALEMPRYRPTVKRLVIAGKGMRQTVSLSSNDSGSQGSESSDVQAFTNVSAIPSTIHDAIVPTIEYSDYIAPTGVFDIVRDQAIAQWQSQLDALLELVDNAPDSTDPFLLDYLRTYIEGLEDTLDLASDQNIEDFTVTVAPEVLPATVPPAVQAGRFITKSNAQIYGFGLIKVTAIVAIIS